MCRKQKTERQNHIRRFTHFIGWVLLCLTVSVKADTLIVLSSDLSSYREVASSLSSHIDTPSKTILLGEYTPDSSSSSFQEVVAVGSKAAAYLFVELPEHQKLYATFLPRQTYQALLEKHKAHPRTKLRNISAVYLDQPYTRQLSLARLISPEATNVATALGPNSQKDLGLLTAAAKKNNFTLLYETLNESDSPIQKLQPLIRNANIFLTLPDKSVFNRTTAKWILYISFRQKIPLIGFSKKYVDAGALAAVFSTPKQIGQQTAELIKKTELKKALPKAEHPKYFSIATNPKAAKALNINIPSSDSLTQKLRELEE